MEVHEFTLLVEGADIQTDTAVNALYEAGCDDAAIGMSGGVQHIEFDREANSFAEAVASAIRAVESAVPGARVARIMPDEYVTLAEIAERTGRTRESVRLLSTGDRGPGDFPVPAARADQRNKLWSWAEVANWFATRLGQDDVDVPEPALSAVNGLLRAHAAMPLLSSSDQDAVLSVRPPIRGRRLAWAAAVRIERTGHRPLTSG